jgi:hypothetical protein
MKLVNQINMNIFLKDSCEMNKSIIFASRYR